ncbi:plasmid stability protein StbA [Kineobactrum sediminis]|uniref:Plasmid stability protein StbA n=1 Tax=Kineobactrum sediminis TaxID=1905677 RepID=A0A2N5Y4L3_9GAMM|nr:ParM/StbA family protein [Kineobactrum sediminis]PLW83317.1 plasmid stability protein StbA [Kineobactrum sediminis]
MPERQQEDTPEEVRLSRDGHSDRHSDPKAVIQLGLDDGYAYTKLALADGRLLAVPSRGRIGQAGITWVDAARQQVFEYDTEGSRYAVGQIDGESTCYDGYPISGLHRAIVQHAFQAANLAGHSVHAVSGLPVSAFYFKDGQKREQAIGLKRESLKIAVRPVSTGGLYATQRRPVAVAFHAVIPEALAAWYDQVIQQRAGEVVLDARQLAASMAIVDIGGRTTDYVVVQDQGIVHRASGSLTGGLLDVHAQVAREIQKRFDLDTLGEQTVATAMASGSVRLHGRAHDVSELVQAAQHELVVQIHAETRRQLGMGAELDSVVFVGGGSAALAEQLADWFPQQRIAEHPGFANARGMLKYLQHVCEEPAPCN